MASSVAGALSSEPHGSKRTASGSPEKDPQSARPAKAVKGDKAPADTVRDKITVEKIEPKVFQVLSWNVDGLDERKTTERAVAAAQECLASPLAPHVIFLQEVTQTTLPVFVWAFLEAGYVTDAWPDGNYFTMVFVKEEGGLANFQITREDFARSGDLGAGSDMGRDMVKVTGDFNNRKVFCMTSHLESTKEGEVKRRRQFSEALRVLNAHSGGPGIFVGDTNLRVKEVKAEQLAKSVHDVWELAGASDATKVTFDTAENNNCPMHDDGIFIKTRYDRAYVNREGARGPISFHLIGKEKTVDGFHPSDHYGVVCTFQW